VLKDPQVHKGQPVLKANKVTRVLPDHRALPALKDRRASRVRKALWDLQVHRDLLVIQAFKDPKGP